MGISKRWAEDWASRYEDQYDDVLKGLHGKSEFSAEDVDKLLDWKLRRLWSQKAKRNFAENPPAFVREVTRRAFSLGDDLAALSTVRVLHGVEVAVGSALLMAHDPLRYTVADRRAWRSLENNGYLARYKDARWVEAWVPYLETCRKLAIRCDLPLRTIDRALWAAAGSVERPESG